MQRFLFSIFKIKYNDYMKITDIAKQLMKPYLKENSICVDFTLGNGWDSKFLLQYPIQRLYAFEIQKDVFIKTKNTIQDARAHLFCVGHENVDDYIKEKIDVGIFNFGYCPKGDQTITTLVETSKIAVKKAVSMLQVGGRIVLVLYVGHAQGKKEAQYFSEWVKQLDDKCYEVMKITLENRQDCPFILAISKLKGE